MAATLNLAKWALQHNRITDDDIPYGELTALPFAPDADTVREWIHHMAEESVSHPESVPLSISCDMLASQLKDVLGHLVMDETYEANHWLLHLLNGASEKILMAESGEARMTDERVAAAVAARKELVKLYWNWAINQFSAQRAPSLQGASNA